jgi:riboflavin kinase/FMN adenylyltransferase
MQRLAFVLGLAGLRRFSGASVATIGSFDGVHLGHQQILKRVVERARQQQLASVVIVFEPQPHEYFARATNRPRLMRLREKVTALLACGIDTVVCLRFNKKLRSLTAQAFIDTVLVDGLHVQHLEVGDDFRFGCDRSGDFALLKAAGSQQGFTVSKSATYEHDGERVSSTRIRRLLAQQQLAEAEPLLGRPYFITGRVVYGKQLGRTINVPTANIGLGRYAAAVSGVYAVTIAMASGDYQGVANVGVKPTISGDHKPVLEVHIFDFAGSIYGQFVTVTFRKALRKEQKFDSLIALQEQIARDIKIAKQYFSHPIIAP